MRMKGFCCLLMLLALLFPCACAQEAVRPIPPALRFTVDEEHVQQVDGIRSVVTFAPHTSRADVNRTLADVQARLTAKCMPALLDAPTPLKDKPLTLKVNTSVSRTGDRWMSFLTLAVLDDRTDQLLSDFDARAYDMLTGAQLTLDDVILPDDASRDALLAALREGVCAYFPDEAPDQAALDRILCREQLSSLAFTLTPGALRFHFYAGDFYPGRSTLLHVKLLYPAIRSLLTGTAEAQTHNEGYTLIALTFDDGPARTRTTTVADMLRRYGADATFFMVGNRIKDHLFAVKYTHDSAFEQESHSYTHTVADLPRSEVERELSAFNAALCEAVGKRASVLRAPGGFERPYLSAKLELPLLHWTVASGDGSANRTYGKRDIQEIFDQVTHRAADGGVVLFHDLRMECTYYLEPILRYLEENQFLCVTVEELFSIKGIPLEPHTTYYGAVRNAQEL